MESPAPALLPLVVYKLAWHDGAAGRDQPPWITSPDLFTDVEASFHFISPRIIFTDETLASWLRRVRLKWNGETADSAVAASYSNRNGGC
jgi:hypothetical protein